MGSTGIADGDLYDQCHGWADGADVSGDSELKMSNGARKQNSANWVPRHLFDLVPLRKLILNDDLERLPELFRKKCECRKIDFDNQTRARMLDTRLLEVAQKKDKPRADAAWGILQQLMKIAQIPD